MSASIVSSVKRTCVTTQSIRQCFKVSDFIDILVISEMEVCVSIVLPIRSSASLFPTNILMSRYISHVEGRIMELGSSIVMCWFDWL